MTEEETAARLRHVEELFDKGRAELKTALALHGGGFEAARRKHLETFRFYSQAAIIEGHVAVEMERRPDLAEEIIRQAVEEVMEERQDGRGRLSPQGGRA